MRKNLLIPALLLASLPLFAQKFVDPANRWNVRNACVDFSTGNTNYWTTRYLFQDSMLLDGLWYHKLQEAADSSYTQLTFTGHFFRQSPDSLVYRRTIDDPEELFYDFSSVEVDIITYQGEEYFVFVDSVPLLDSAYRRRFTLQRISGTNPPQIVWIDGIGNLKHPFSPLLVVQFDCWTKLACFRQDSVLLYQDGPCELPATSSTTIAEYAGLSLFPNPASTMLTLHSAGIPTAEIRIFDRCGRLVRAIALESGFANVYIGDLPPGWYTAARWQQGTALTTARFVKN